MSKETPIFPILDPFLYCPKTSTVEAQSHGKAFYSKLKTKSRNRRSWWKTTASAALLFRGHPKKTSRYPYPAVSQLLYLVDGADESAPPRRANRQASGSGGVPYVSLRHLNPAAAPRPAPIYLVT